MNKVAGSTTDTYTCNHAWHCLNPDSVKTRSLNGTSASFRPDTKISDRLLTARSLVYEMHNSVDYLATECKRKSKG